MSSSELLVLQGLIARSSGNSAAYLKGTVDGCEQNVAKSEERNLQVERKSHKGGDKGPEGSVRGGPLRK